MNKRIFLSISACLLILNAFAQKERVKNQPYGDQRLYHFGITVGLNAQDMILTNSGYTGNNGETWFCEIPDYSLGFNAGLIADLYLNSFINLRFTPTIHFGDKQFTFKEENTQETFTTVVRSNYLTFPVDVKFSSMRINNYRPYFFTGIYGALDLGTQKNEPVLLKPLDYGVQLGIGCDLYLPIVKICPEIRFYFGLADLIEKNRSDLQDKGMLKYTEALSRGSSRMIVLTFNFE